MKTKKLNMKYRIAKANPLYVMMLMMTIMMNAIVKVNHLIVFLTWPMTSMMMSLWMMVSLMTKNALPLMVMKSIVQPSDVTFDL